MDTCHEHTGPHASEEGCTAGEGNHGDCDDTPGVPSYDLWSITCTTIGTDRCCVFFSCGSSSSRQQTYSVRCDGDTCFVRHSGKCYQNTCVDDELVADDEEVSCSGLGI